MKKKHFKIGTRGSLLALTQCLQVKKQLEEMSDATYELIIIKTEGDENTEKPLWQMDGKDFFTKELDTALLKGEIDLVVHSYKDLGSERPIGIELAAITQRKFPHDVLLMRKSVVKELQSRKRSEVLVGTSSPRRMTNLENYLAPYLPYGEELKVKTESLRGNVNTRIKKCKDGAFDAIVLALPGIERLALGLPDHQNEAFEKHGDPREILSGLLDDFDFMILPTSTFPAAASQGALGIECLEESVDQSEHGLKRHQELKEILNKLNHERTIEEVKIERKRFQEFGGGCHLAVGITASKGAGFLRQSLRGVADEKIINELSLITEKKQYPKISKAFIGLSTIESFKELDLTLEKDQVFIKTACNYKEAIPTDACHDYFFTSPSTVDYGSDLLNLEMNSLWASGNKTMKALASKGLWVNGSADSLGESTLKVLRESELVKLMKGEPSWKVITNNEVENDLGPTIGVYKKEVSKGGQDYLSSLETCDFYYWTSPTQYQWFKENTKLNPKALHGSGLGKTAACLDQDNDLPRDQRINFSTMTELKNWLRKNQ